MHKLVGLEVDGVPVFDTVIVVTDRQVQRLPRHQNEAAAPTADWLIKQLNHDEKRARRIGLLAHSIAPLNDHSSGTFKGGGCQRAA